MTTNGSRFHNFVQGLDPSNPVVALYAQHSIFRMIR